MAQQNPSTSTSSTLNKPLGKLKSGFADAISAVSNTATLISETASFNLSSTPPPNQQASSSVQNYLPPLLYRPTACHSRDLTEAFVFGRDAYIKSVNFEREKAVNAFRLVYMSSEICSYH